MNETNKNKGLPVRRIMREYVLQCLYQLEMRHKQPVPALLEQFWQQMKKIAERSLSPKEWKKIQKQSEDYIHDIYQQKDLIDEQIRVTASNWRLERILILDQNILRIAIYELTFRSDIPPAVSINEAIELAKEYSSEKSSQFINGILDKIRHDTKTKTV